MMICIRPVGHPYVFNNMVQFKDLLVIIIPLYHLQALRVSMEEQRQRQEEEARRAAVVSAAEAGVPSPADGKRMFTSQFSTQANFIAVFSSCFFMSFFHFCCRE